MRTGSRDYKIPCERAESSQHLLGILGASRLAGDDRDPGADVIGSQTGLGIFIDDESSQRVRIDGPRIEQRGDVDIATAQDLLVDDRYPGDREDVGDVLDSQAAEHQLSG